MAEEKSEKMPKLEVDDKAEITFHIPAINDITITLPAGRAKALAKRLCKNNEFKQD